MQDDVSDIRPHYNADPQNEHDRLIRHQLEYEITVALFKLHLPSQTDVLKIGAATGRYTVDLLAQGHKVTVTDLSPAMIRACAGHVADAGYADSANYYVADARDLSKLGDAHFDAVLLMGPH